MMSNPRGIALIINNEVFSPSADLTDRQGSEKDVEALEGMFKALYFKVNIERNLGKEKILQVLDKVAKGDHTAYDCFVLCLMSHGQEGLGILFTVGNVDRDIGRYSGRHSGRYSGRQSVDSRSTVGRYSVASRSTVGRYSVDSRST